MGDKKVIVAAPKDNRYFIISPGRAGTKWLAWILSRLLFDYTVLHEPPLCLESLANGRYYGSIDKDEAINELRNLRETTISTMFYYTKRGGYIEVNNHLTALGGDIREAFPDDYVRILGLVRDGRTFCRSALNKGFYRSRRDTDYMIPRRGTPIFEKWKELTNLQKCAWYWTEKCRMTRKYSERVFKLEDLSGVDYYKHWVDFLQFCRFRSFGEWELQDIDKMRVVRVNKVNYKRRERLLFKDWARERQEEFWEIAGEEMKVLGYGERNG